MRRLPIKSISKTWGATWHSVFMRKRVIAGTLILLAVVFTLPIFFGYIEKRHGTLLHDAVLAAIPAHNVSVPIFTLIWGMILFGCIRALYSPRIFITFCWSLMFVLTARLGCILLFPLEPPIGLIPLKDPLTGVFYGNATIIKDLFFSGHTAVLTLIVLCLEKRNDKIVGAIATMAVMVLLLVQHIHYTLDVVAAPPIAFAFHRAVRYFLYRNRRKAKIIPQEELLPKSYSIAE